MIFKISSTISQFIAKFIIINYKIFYHFHQDNYFKNFSDKIVVKLVFWSFKQMDHFSSDKLSNLNYLQLKSALRYAHNSIPFWRKRLDAVNFRLSNIRDLADIKKIPILTREDLQCAGGPGAEPYFNQNLSQDRLVSAFTSGSTGQPLRVIHDKRCSVISRSAKFLLSLSRLDIILSEKNKMIDTTDRLNQYVLNALYFRFNWEKADFAGILAENQSVILETTPYDILKLAQTILREKTAIEFRVILSAGSHLSRDYRLELESVLKVPIYGLYGCTELGPIAVECEEKNGLHLLPGVILEIVDDNNEPVPIGSLGSILLTGLCHEATPIIRYKIGDMGRFLPGTCICGINSPKIEIEGRDLWYFKLPNNEKPSYDFVRDKIIKPSIWLKIKQFQFVQESMNHIKLYIVSDGTLTPEDLRSLKPEFNPYLKKLFQKINFEIIIARDIYSENTRKPKEFVSKI